MKAVQDKQNDPDYVVGIIRQVSEQYSQDSLTARENYKAYCFGAMQVCYTILKQIEKHEEKNTIKL